MPAEPVVPDPPPLPGRRVLSQRWSELAYFHWPYDPTVVAALLPPGVTVDTIDGAAWVGLIPFTMRDVAIGPAPPIPWLGTFIEINVRTYVIDRLGRRAVWFFSLDVPRAAIVAVARSVFALPYCWSNAEHHREGARHEYRMNRRWPRGRATADIRFTVGEPIASDDVSELDHFLTARWALLTARQDRLLYGAVEHPRWPLHRIDQFSVDQDVVEAAGLPSPEGPARALYSRGVDVRLSWLTQLSKELSQHHRSRE